MSIYVFKPYDPIFPILYKRKKERLSKFIIGKYPIEHIGSTAIPNLGGKGIIDIMIAVPKGMIKKYLHQLQKAGYKYVEKSGNENRLFLWQDLPDEKESFRRYHIHLTYTDSKDFNQALAFKNYLLQHPEVVQEYAKVKQKLLNSNKITTEEYMTAKEPTIQKILRQAIKHKGLIY